MEDKMETMELLDLVAAPVFCVHKGFIESVNPAAAKLLLQPGMSLDCLMVTGQTLYSQLDTGCLYVTLDIYGVTCGASVSRKGERDIFVLEQAIDSGELRALALAARELRAPLSEAMVAASRLSDSDTVSRLGHSLHQLLRIVSNMSDASGCSPVFRPQNRNMDALFREICEKAAVLTESTGVRLQYSGLSEEVVSSADAQLLERALLNLISNALKFTSVGGTIQVSLTRQGNFLSLRVTDSGSGIPADVRANLFRRHLREPAIEDSRYGLGLGLLLVRNAAASHGGAVLIDHPSGRGTRVTMTLAIRPASGQLHSNALHVDYAGEQDHAKIELSDCLPASLY